MSIIKKNFIFIFIFIFLSNCQGLRDFKEAMTGRKVHTTDEFLIKKKDPLILPPKYDELPLPKGGDFQEKEENKIKSILKTDKNSEIKKGSSVSSLEKKILEELRKN
jgi:hypothetical protein